MTETRAGGNSTTPAAAGLPVAIYARADGPDAGRSIDVQLVACRGLAAASGLVVSHELVDKGNPVRSRPRPAFAELLEMLAAGSVGGVVAYDVDRFTRRPQELQSLAAAADATGAKVHTVTAGAFDLSTPPGRFGLSLLAAAATR